MHSLHELRYKIAAARHTDIVAWHGRVVVLIAAAVAGLVVVFFAKATEYAIDFFFSMQQQNRWLPLILTPIAGMLIVWVANRWFKGSAGSGIPQTIAALHQENVTNNYPRLISLKLAIAKIMLGLSAIAAGFSSGREGPSVQIAASIMHSFRHLLPKGFSVNPKHLILAGGAAGISAAFNTPLAGIVFAIEELGKRFEEKTNGVVIAAIVLSGLVSVSLQGNYTYFGHLSVASVDKSIFYPIIVCSIICGIFGGVFSKTLISSTKIAKGKIHAVFHHLHPIWWTGFCGLIVALLGVVTDGAAHGSGYSFTNDMLAGGAHQSWWYAPAKYLATIFTYLSGVPGGIFAPSLSIGAGIGNDLLAVFGQHYQATSICALCMAGFLSAVTQAPITSFVIVMEMIDGHEMVISLMAIALLSAIISKLFSPPLYSTLANLHLSKVT